TASTRIVLLQLEPVQVTLPHEGIGEHLDVSDLGQGPPDSTAQTLAVGQPPPGGTYPDRGDVLITFEPDDLLDEIVGVDQVGTPRRWDHGEHVLAGLDGASDGAQPLLRGARGIVDPGDRSRVGVL